MSGRLESIHVAAASRSPMSSLERCEVTVDDGLQGDRHGSRRASGQVTVVASEELATAAAEGGFTIEPGATRRNLTVSGVELRHEAGFRLRIGPAFLEFKQSSQPCGLMTKLFGATAKAALRDRAGIEMRVLRGGELRCGDAVTIEPSAAQEGSG